MAVRVSTVEGTVSKASSPARHASVAAPRIDAIDITKGVLVVLMVVYHSLNYSTQYHLPFRYLYFLPPSFILISGFLLSHVYLTRSRTLDRKVTRRLLSRGAKLFALFVALNVGAQFVRSQNYHRPSLGLSGFFAEWPEVFLWGGSHIAAFDILLPIAYLLLFSPPLLWLTRLHRAALPMLTLVLLTTCTLMERVGECPSNLLLITAGVVGMLAGSLPNSTVNIAGRLLPLTLPTYIVHFFIGLRLGQPFLHQMLGAFLAVTAIYGFGVAASARSWPGRRLAVLGQYSLVAYIGQIAIFQFYTHILGRPEPASSALFGMFFATLGVTVALVELTRWAEAQSKPFQFFYRAVIP